MSYKAYGFILALKFKLTVLLHIETEIIVELLLFKRFLKFTKNLLNEQQK